jgi:site-specific DNA recombinase
MLSGLVVCGQCGQHFTGNVAYGRSARYRYYTCRSRHRYGTSSSCPSARLSADALDAAVLDSLLSAYEKTDLFEQALARSASQIADSRAKCEAAIKTATAEIRDAEERIRRYLLAFESGHLPEVACGERIKELTSRIAELRNRRADLCAEVDAELATAPTETPTCRASSAGTSAGEARRDSTSKSTRSSARTRNQGREPRSDHPGLQMAFV